MAMRRRHRYSVLSLSHHSQFGESGEVLWRIKWAESAFRGSVIVNDFMELRYVFRLILKWWWLLIIGFLVGAALSFGFTSRQTPIYQAAATILVGQSIQSTDLSSSDIRTSELLALTYADIARRQPVLQGVVDTLGLDKDWQEIKSLVRISPVAETQLLEIRVEDNSPELARAIADEIAHQLVLISPTASGNQQDESTQFVLEQLADLQLKIETGQEELRTKELIDITSLSETEQADLLDERALLESNITNWQSNYTRLLGLAETQTTLNYISIVEPALVSSDPISPNVELNTLVGGIVGLSLAVVFVFLREFLDDTFKSQDEVTQAFNLVPLGKIGEIKGKELPEKLITINDYFAPNSEAYRMIRSNIQFMSVERPLQAIIVTSPSNGDGKSTTVANLAVVMAQAGNKTVIVDANLRHPSQHLIFEIQNVGGVTNLILSPELEVKDCLVETLIPNLQLLPSGDLPPNPSELLGSARMNQLVTQLREEADVIIFDSPPVVDFTDAVVLSNLADLAILVIQTGMTRRELTKQAVFNLVKLDKIRLGTILNHTNKRRKMLFVSPFASG